MTLRIVICPGCAKRLPLRNRGCPRCRYENGSSTVGRILTLQEMLDAPSMIFDDVCSGFLRRLVAAALDDQIEPPRAA